MLYSVRNHISTYYMLCPKNIFHTHNKNIYLETRQICRAGRIFTHSYTKSGVGFEVECFVFVHIYEHMNISAVLDVSSHSTRTLDSGASSFTHTKCMSYILFCMFCIFVFEHMNMSGDDVVEVSPQSIRSWLLHKIQQAQRTPSNTFFPLTHNHRQQ